MHKKIRNYVVYLAWIQSVIATAGSLFLSEIMNFPPCKLCWYQRIAMYPLTILIAVGIIRKERKLYWYVLPFSVIGLGIAFYHNLLNYHLLPDSVSSCTAGVSCATDYFNLLGFITIPFLSFVAFLVISICMIIFWQDNRKNVSIN